MNLQGPLQTIVQLETVSVLRQKDDSEHPRKEVHKNKIFSNSLLNKTR